MSNTQRFRDQHDILLRIASEISIHLNAGELSKDASKARQLVSKLLGKLNMHLAMEDKSLYPRLLKDSDERIKAMAKQFINEMGGIGEAVEGYQKKWVTASEIQKDPNGFIQHTKGILNALAQRIDKENRQLYKAVDQM